MGDKGFELLSRQWIKGQGAGDFGTDLEYEFVFRRLRRKK
jgi:hypothetical protein